MDHTETINIPKIFWKYFDVYRRKIISIEEFSKNSGLSYTEIQRFLELTK